MGVAKDDVFRIKSGIKFTLSYFAAEGSTFLPRRLLCEKTGELLDIDMESIEDAITEMPLKAMCMLKIWTEECGFSHGILHGGTERVQSLASLSSAPLNP